MPSADVSDAEIATKASGSVLATPRAYRCRCGRQLFFRNSQCLGCRASVGYVPSQQTLTALEPAPKPMAAPATADSAAPHVYQRCGNFATAAACNWVIEPDESGCRHTLCRACRLNRTIPDLSQPRNLPLWLSMERAKRRLVSQLIGLGLPLASKVCEDPARGLAYDFLRSPPSGRPVITGYAQGVITINLEEANDAYREQTRLDMGEPYRTLLGHFRHEVGHYYWQRLVAGTKWQATCTELFGDERGDYAAALTHNYAAGPPAHWRQSFVSAYASVHPSEDWAESWAHYLHLRDTLDTAESFGIEPQRIDVESAPFDATDVWPPGKATAAGFLDMLHRWILITGVMNEMSRAMGQHDFYPFVLPQSAVAKLHFIHCVILDARTA